MSTILQLMSRHGSHVMAHQFIEYCHDIQIKCVESQGEGRIAQMVHNNCRTMQTS